MNSYNHNGTALEIGTVVTYRANDGQTRTVTIDEMDWKNEEPIFGGVELNPTLNPDLPADEYAGVWGYVSQITSIR